MICTNPGIVCHRTRQVRGSVASVCQYRIENGISTEMNTILMEVGGAGFPLFRFTVLGNPRLGLYGFADLKILLCDEDTKARRKS